MKKPFVLAVPALAIATLVAFAAAANAGNSASATASASCSWKYRNVWEASASYEASASTTEPGGEVHAEGKSNIGPAKAESGSWPERPSVKVEDRSSQEVPEGFIVHASASASATSLLSPAAEAARAASAVCGNVNVGDLGVVDDLVDFVGYLVDFVAVDGEALDPALCIPCSAGAAAE